MNKNQKGFSVVEGLLFLIIIGVLGFVGWYVWHSKNAADDNLKNAASTNIAAPTNKAAATQNSTPSEEYKMPEVKLQLSIPASLSNLQYTAVANDAGIYSLEFSDKRLQKPNCDSNAPSGLFEIAFADATQSDGSPLKDSTAYKQIGDTYWNLNVYPKTSCSNGTTEDSIYQTDSELLKSSWRSLSAY